MSKITYEKLYRKSSFYSATSILKLECHFSIFFFFSNYVAGNGEGPENSEGDSLENQLPTQVFYVHLSRRDRKGTSCAQQTTQTFLLTSSQTLIGSWPFSVSLSIHCVSSYKTSIRSSIRKGSTCPPDLLFSTEGKGGAFKRQLEAG